MIRSVLVWFGALGFLVLVAVPPASGGLPDEVKCEAQKIKTAGKLAAKEVGTCYRAQAKDNTDPAPCITEQKTKFDKKVTKTDQVFENCPTEIDSARAQSLIDLYSLRIADAAASNYSGVTCTALCEEEWTFPVDAGERVRAVADVTDPNSGADLALLIDCDVQGLSVLSADNEDPCTYPSKTGAGCPDGTFTSSDTQICTVKVYVKDNSGCQHPGEVANYRLRISTSGHTPTNVNKVTPDTCAP
jgi:hypothetical protein